MAVDSLAAGWAKALSVDRKQFNLFFEKMMDGFAYHRIVVDKSGKPVDYIFLEVNTAFERMTGLRKEKILGKKVTEVLKGIQNDPADWIGVYGRVALTGEPVQFENCSESLGKWFNVSAYCPEKNYFVALFEDITERKNVEKSLKTISDRFYNSLSKMHGAILLVSADGRVEFANQAFCDYFKLKESPEELKGLSSAEMIEKVKNGYLNPDQQVRRIKEILDSGKIVIGEEVTMQDNRTCLRDFIPIHSGKSFSRLWHHMDITEQKKTETALKKSEERFRSVLSNSLDIVYRLNLQTGSYEYMSPATKELVGFEPEEMMTMSNEEVFLHVHPEDLPKLRLELARATESGKGLIEYRFMGKDGKYHWWSNQLIIVKDREGKPLYRDGFVRDITKRKNAEDALSASEEKASDLIKYAPSGIYELDYHIPPKFRSVNDAMCQILGYTREELLAMSPFALLDYESQMRFRERIMKMSAGEKVDETAEFKVIPKNGREIYAVLYTTFTYKDGKPDGALVIAHDVTERRKGERALEERAKNLESLVEERTKALRDSERLAAIGTTAGMVGHDIRNPLQAITGDVYLAKTELASMPQSDEKKYALESLDAIEDNVAYINKIVADLQDYARPIKPLPKETNLETLIERLWLKNGIPKNIKVSSHIEGDAKEIVADADLLKRILGNLVMNAVQAMPEGGRLDVHAFRDGDDHVIAVKDTGVGIPEGAKAKLFTPLFTTKSKGQGLGLAVVKRLTESLGGAVSFESQEGKGTTFIVRLPQRPVTNERA